MNTENATEPENTPKFHADPVKRFVADFIFLFHVVILSLSLYFLCCKSTPKHSLAVFAFGYSDNAFETHYAFAVNIAVALIIFHSTAEKSIQ